MYTTKSEVAVFVHGCHTEAQLGDRSWQNLVWGGDDKQLPTFFGRVPMAILVALHRNAKSIVFSTGASEKDGLKEAEYTYRFMMDRIGELAMILSLAVRDIIDAKELRSWIEKRTILDLESQNTAQETSMNLERVIRQGCNEVIGVTNAFHAPRCLAALQNAARNSTDGLMFVSVVPTLDDPSGVVILEPPHRGDCPKTKFHLLGRRLFKIGAPDLPQFEDEFDGLLKKYGA